ncbi:MAG TPA: hypothetical protein VMV44_05145 [Rectinemataceae bacterium]|nr:hypothetical protein [Rectinemataceae bacterium]
MHIIDMTLYLDIELSGLDEVSDVGRFVIVFESAEELEYSGEWIERRLAHPASRIKETLPAEMVDWRTGPFILMLYNGAVEYAECVVAQKDAAAIPLAPGLPEPSLAHHHA